MKKLLLLFSCLSVFAAKSQNGFTTYTTNIAITGGFKMQKAFLVDNSGNKWIGFLTMPGSGTNTANAGLLKYDNSTWTLYNRTSSPAFPSYNVTALAKDNSGNIWIGCDSGLVKFDGSVFTTYSTLQGLPMKRVNCVETVGNQVYVGTNMGLSRFDGVSFTNYNVSNGALSDDVVLSIKSENQNLLWIGASSRLIEFNINSSFTSTSYIDHATTVFSQVNCIHIDSQNNKWLGTNNAGIVRYNALGFQNITSLFSGYIPLIPSNIKDITSGPHGGIIFMHQVGTASYPSAHSGLTELLPNGNSYQYFYPVKNYFLGDFIENDGSNILVSAKGADVPKVYYQLIPTNYNHNIAPLGSVNSNNFKTLDINNVKAGIANRSDMHWEVGGAGNAMYEVPKGSGKHSNFASALWVGGLDNGGQLHGGAQTYRQGGVDFWPGPLKVTDASVDSATSVQYDKIWKVSYTEINDFINNYNSGNVQNGSYTIPNDILTWPGNGDVNNNQAAILAPFEDLNADGMYNPMDGDYPKIKGDQALFFIYNDNLAAHSTASFTPMGIEVHGMAYAYGCPAVVNGHNELTYTTFYDYKIINRSSNNYHDVFVGLWSDVDLGYYGDDYIGCNVSDNYGFTYNADANDETVAATQGYGSYIPAQGFNILRGPDANLNDGIDNNNNGVIDEPNEDCKLNNFNFYNNSFAGVPLQTTDPTNGKEYYNYLTGFWKDATPFTCGGTGYGGVTNTNWAYPGDPTGTVSSDPANTCGNWVENGVAGDRRMILSSGPFSMAPGQIQEVEYAFVTSFDSSAAFGGAMSLGKLKSDIQKVNTFYNLTNKPNCLQSINVGITEVPKQNDFSLFPNPAKSLITISSTINGTVKLNYEIVDVLGKVVMQNNHESSDKFSINISDLNSGIYFVRLQVNNSVVVKKFVKE